MERYCRFNADGITVSDVLDFPEGAKPQGVLSAELVSLYSPCPGNIEANWRRVAGEWLEPLPVVSAESPVIRPIVTPAQFERLFTIDETIAILDSANRKVTLSWARYTAAGSPDVDLNLASVQAFVDLLIAETLVAAERREAILSGTAQ